MRALVQRVAHASVTVNGQTVGSIGPGLLILLGIRTGDTRSEARWVADKCVNLRIFEDEAGKFNLSALDTGGDVLVVSQFTLYGDTRRGRRPSFTEAAPPEESETLYEYFLACLSGSGLKTESGVFGAMMNVNLTNDGPVTVLVEKDGDRA